MCYRLSLLLMLITSLALAGDPIDEPIPGPIPGQVLHVVDGDTVRVRARIWLGQEVETNVRLAGIDTAERHAHCDYERIMAEKATDYVERLLAESDGISLMDVTYDKYGKRVVARLITASGKDVSNLLLQTGMAHPYDGGHKQSWCGE